MSDNPYANLEIKPGLNERGNYEVGYTNDAGAWMTYYEAIDYSGAVMACHFSELYRFLDFIMYPDDYITQGALSLMLVEKTAKKIRERIDNEIKAAGIDLVEEFLQNKKGVIAL